MPTATIAPEEATTVFVKPFDFADGVVMHQRRLPHWRQEGCAYFLTFRLADSLPQPVLREWAEVRRKWKGATAHTINQRLGRTGTLWAPEPYDHIVRNHHELMRFDSYVRANPDKAGLHEGRYRIGGSTANWVFRVPEEAG